MKLYDIEVKSIDGEAYELKRYEGKVLLIVNTASKCGFTKQFETLEKLYKNHKDSGFVVLGFPCNQFLRQEPLSHEEIVEFCTLHYGVTFPMHEKIDVKKKTIHPLYKHLTENAPKGQTGTVKWNFEKFLIGKDGTILKRYRSKVDPLEIEHDVKKALEA